MERKKIGRCAVAWLLTLSLVLGGALPLYAVENGITPTYDEAYYGMLDYYGGLKEGSIVKSYVTNGVSELTDYGTYDSLENLTDGTVPTQEEDGKITFSFTEGVAPTHFYFQGSTTAPYENLPWKLQLQYKLNGVPVEAEELAGASGMVEIEIDAIPNMETNPYIRYNYTLEAVALFNQDDILSLEAPDAQVQLIGNLRSVLFLALPGEEQHFTIRVGTESFAFGGMTFLMVPATLGQLKQIAELSRRKNDLEENYRKLSGSLDSLLDSLDAVSSDLVRAAGGLDAVNHARETVSSQKGQVYEKADVLRENLNTVNEALQPMTDDLANTSEALTETNETVRALTEKTVTLCTELDTLKEYLTEVRGNKKEFLDLLDEIKRLQKELNALAPALENLDVNVYRNNVHSQTKSTMKDLKEAKPIYQTYVNACKRSDDGRTQSMDCAEFIYAAATAAGQDAKGAVSLYQLIGAVCAANSMTKPDVYTIAADTVKKNAVMTISDLYTADAETQHAILQSVAACYAALQGNATLSGAQLMLTARRIPQETVLATAKALSDSFHNILAMVASFDRTAGEDKTIEHFSEYLDALYPLITNSTQKKKMEKLMGLCHTDAETVELLIRSTDDISDMLTAVDDDIDENVRAANATIGSLTEPTADVVRRLSVLCQELDDLRSLLDTTDDFLKFTAENTEKISEILTAVEALQQVLDSYEPKAQRVLTHTEDFIGATSETLTHTKEFAETLESVMRSSGNELDAAAQQSLSTLSSSLRSIASSLQKTKEVRRTKDVLTDLVEDTWEEHTGGLDTILMMDPTADPISLTDERNPSPASVQIMLRTQEVKKTEQTEKNLSESTGDGTQEQAQSKSTLWGKIVDMFKGTWFSLTGWLRT